MNNRLSATEQPLDSDWQAGRKAFHPRPETPGIFTSLTWPPNESKPVPFIIRGAFGLIV